jgi:hypothetical protein
MIDARSVAVQGIGFAALAIALQGFAPAEAQAQQSGGGTFAGAAGIKAPSRHYETPRVRETPQGAAERRETPHNAAALAIAAKVAAGIEHRPQQTAHAETQQRDTGRGKGQTERQQLPQASGTATRLAHNQEIPGATPGPATEQQRDLDRIAEKAKTNRNRAAILIALLMS